MMIRARVKLILLIVLLFSLGIYLMVPIYVSINAPHSPRVILPGIDRLKDVSVDSPFIFVGGIPRSGTTLMRALLDTHPLVRCGEETRVIPRVLNLYIQWKNTPKEWGRLLEAGVTDEVLDNAISSFIIQVIVGHGAPAERLCNKDPLTLKFTDYLAHLFPNGKFVLMIRDGRATIHSVITRKVSITGYDLTNPRQCLDRWNSGISIMYQQCLSIGDSRCLMVYYEQLVLHPEKEIRRVLEFLDLPWTDMVLHHEQFIGSDISLSNVERSSDQVVKPIYLDALTKWVGFYPEDVVRDMATIAPMLAILGYDPNANPPNYGQPDPMVLKNTGDLHVNKEFWDQKTEELLSKQSKRR